jgi:hypothetical protein
MKYSETILKRCSQPICIVGNAETIRKNGGLIDSFPTVIRINNFKIDGYEDYIGSKTTLRCINAWLNIEHKNMHREFSPFHIKSKECKYHEYYSLRNENPVATAYTDIHTVIDKKIINPSTGLALIQLCTLLGITVDLFGFDGFKTGHYWEKCAHNLSHHSTYEKRYMRKLNARLH